MAARVATMPLLTLTTRPQRRSSIPGSSAKVSPATFVTLRVKARANCSTSTSVLAPRGATTAALLMRMSTRPSWSRARRASAVPAPGAARSATIGCARPPAATMALVVSTSSASERAATATWAPRCASCRTMARPMPRPPPVIRAVLSPRWVMEWSCVVGGSGSHAAARPPRGPWWGRPGRVVRRGGSAGDDALAADGARHGDRADSRQRAAASVRRVQGVPHPDDPARGGLSGGDRRHLSQRAVALDAEDRNRAGAGLGHGQVSDGANSRREPDGPRQRGHDRVQRRATEGVDVEDLDGARVALRGHEQLAAFGRERHLAGRGEELRRRVGVETQRAVPRWDRRQQRANAAVALDRAAVAGVEHVDDVAVHRHGDRKLPSVGRTWRRSSRSPLIASTVIVLLPTSTAMSWPFS